MKIFSPNDRKAENAARNVQHGPRNTQHATRPFLSALLALTATPLPLLADLPGAPSPAEIGTWVNVGMLFLNGAVAIVTILSVSRTAKREVTFAFEPASKEEFERHVLDQAEALKAFNHELTSLREEMRKDRDQILLAGENRVSKLHERINTILEAVSEMRGRISTH